MKIIQFIHPGAEQSKSNGSVWNSGSHKRKFIKSKGLIMDSNQQEYTGEIGFWGEWEAQSNYYKITNRTSGLPKYITEPYYSFPSGQNTDPFVFGEQMYYFLCQQGYSQQLRALEKGDIIMFGSCKNKSFVLDTLFVVGSYFEYSSTNMSKLKDKVNSVFYDVSIQQMLKSKAVTDEKLEEKKGCFIPKCNDYTDKMNCFTKGEKIYRVYKAAMYKSKEVINGIFSFAPAVSLEKNPNGFARPKIALNNIITNNLTQGFKVSKIENELEAKRIWNEIVAQIHAQGIDLMVYAELPRKK